MKIIVDENIVYAADFFEKTGSVKHELVLKAGRDISQVDLIDADALLVRSVTQVNASLLNNTSVKFVGTATIGTDHIDQAYLDENGIAFADAAGCSADTVAQYVVTAVHELRPSYLQEKITLGIIGYGNIGKALATIAKQLGWQCLVYDPFVDKLADTERSFMSLVSLAEVLTQTDVISLHVPLTYPNESKYPTHHLINAQALEKIPVTTLLINSARGKVICERDLLNDIAQTNREVVLDVFEHEPELSVELVNALALATPHIAGYSLEGKARGTQFIYDAFCAWQGLKPSMQFESFLPNEQDYVSGSVNQPFNSQLVEQLPRIYRISLDSDALAKSVKNANSRLSQKRAFDLLRKNYSLRREWQAYGL